MSRSSLSPSRDGGGEYSPDWLRNHKAPSSSVWTLSSSTSTSTSDDDDQLPISSVKPPPPVTIITQQEVDVEVEEEEDVVSQRDNTTTDEKHTGHQISSSTLPLLLPDKPHRSKVLVECEGDSIDLSGDLGSVGRLVFSDSHQHMLFDLKGTIYKTTIIPSTTFCVVSFGHSEAKIEAIMNDFVHLNPQSNVYEAETMVEGTLEGFLFDSEDEGDDDKHASRRQTDENETETNGKTREASKKKGRIAVKKPPAKKKKPPVAAKKTKARK